MDNQKPAPETLQNLLATMLDGQLSDQQASQLGDLLRDDTAARRQYLRQVATHAMLQWTYLPHGTLDSLALQEPDATLSTPCPPLLAEQKIAESCVASELPPIVLDLSPGPQTPSVFAPGGMLFSYGVAALVVAVGLLVGWARQVAHYDDLAQTGAAPSAAARTEIGPEPAREPELRFVGRITGMVDCQWADASTEAAAGSFVPQGRKYALASGLLEITYDTGAKVILQGPCSYEVDASDGGFLALGKLTAKVEKKAASEAATTNHSPLATHRSPLFTVRTPTSIVTDLGTEFAVEVDKSGASRAHVFRGTVEVRPGDRTRSGDPPILLEANQSASVAVGRDGVASVRRESGAPSPGAFARALPKRVRIKLFNTGVGLKEGDPDPHWQIVARSDDPNFKPRPAVVIPVSEESFLPNDPLKSQWLSLGRLYLPDDVIYTFRTTFDLHDGLPSTAILRGQFMADNRVVAIRLNGHKLIVPYHTSNTPFNTFYRFVATEGFVAGINVIEIDVLNGGAPPAISDKRSPMSCRMEFEGAVIPDWKKTGYLE